MRILISLFLWAIGLAIALLPTALLVLWVIWQRRSNARRSPLTTDLHHLPGEQAGNQAERLMEKANERLLTATLIGPAVLVAWAFQRIDLRLIHFGISEGILLLCIVIVAFWSARSGVSLLQQRRRYLDGLAAERATAQDLAPLIAKGCAIYHDVPGSVFNLDHVVIGPGKVYMVETKSRQKPAGKAPKRRRSNLMAPPLSSRIGATPQCWIRRAARRVGSLSTSIARLASAFALNRCLLCRGGM